MKKFIAILLSVLMILSSLGAVAFAAEEETTSAAGEESSSQSTADKLVEVIGFSDALKNFNSDGTQLPDNYLDSTTNQYDIETLLQSGLLNDVNMFGLSVDFLYNSTDPLYWSTISIKKDDLALAMANLNMYLLGVLKKKIGSEGSVKLFTAENATSISNFIGHLINPDFEDVKLTGDEYSNSNGFYSGIATASGLGEVIQHNWCDQNSINFKVLLYVLGFDFDDEDMLGLGKWENGQLIAKTLVRNVISEVLNSGPLNYILTLVSNMAKTYGLYMYEPLKALFKAHIVAGNITEEELGTMRGLFNLIFNGNDKSDTEHLQFISVPAYRFAMATSVSGSASSSSTDTTEMFLYMMLYLNLVGKYKSNPNAIENIKEQINQSDLADSDKSNINTIINGLFLGDLSELTDILDDLFLENLETTKATIKENLLSLLTSFFTNIANIIQKMIDSIRNFGNF